MIIKTISINELGYDYDIVNGCNGSSLKNGEAPPIIVDVNKDGTYSLSDGYHRLSGILKTETNEITIGIIEQSDWDEFYKTEAYTDCYDEYETLVDWLSDKI